MSNAGVGGGGSQGSWSSSSSLYQCKNILRQWDFSMALLAGPSLKLRCWIGLITPISIDNLRLSQFHISYSKRCFYFYTKRIWFYLIRVRISTNFMQIGIKMVLLLYQKVVCQNTLKGVNRLIFIFLDFESMNVPRKLLIFIIKRLWFYECCRLLNQALKDFYIISYI